MLHNNPPDLNAIKEAVDTAKFLPSCKVVVNTGTSATPGLQLRIISEEKMEMGGNSAESINLEWLACVDALQEMQTKTTQRTKQHRKYVEHMLIISATEFTELDDINVFIESFQAHFEKFHLARKNEREAAIKQLLTHVEEEVVRKQKEATNNSAESEDKSAHHTKPLTPRPKKIVDEVKAEPISTNDLVEIAKYLEDFVKEEVSPGCAVTGTIKDNCIQLNISDFYSKNKQLNDHEHIAIKALTSALDSMSDGLQYGTEESADRQAVAMIIRLNQKQSNKEAAYKAIEDLKGKYPHHYLIAQTDDKHHTELAEAFIDDQETPQRDPSFDRSSSDSSIEIPPIKQKNNDDRMFTEDERAAILKEKGEQPVKKSIQSIEDLKLALKQYIARIENNNIGDKIDFKRKLSLPIFFQNKQAANRKINYDTARKLLKQVEVIEKATENVSSPDRENPGPSREDLINKIFSKENIKGIRSNKTAGFWGGRVNSSDLREIITSGTKLKLKK